MRTIFGSLILVGFLLSGTVWAENPDELKQDRREIRSSKASLDKLNRLIDKWHEANLAGDNKKVRQYELAIINLFVKDLNATFHALDRAERERAKERKGQDKGGWVADEKDFAAARTILASKQVLLYKWKVSDSFSLKYLVLSNYRRLLKKELGMAALEFAEDVREIKKDKR
ncbi:MAG: hypothetical protein JSV52_04160 [Candidatus Zixiibacteriota bacterium]|nr:MAG: hypothetical protein JSV52_04160 [candidate division Zixibacteria bacterium]